MRADTEKYEELREERKDAVPPEETGGTNKKYSRVVKTGSEDEENEVNVAGSSSKKTSGRKKVRKIVLWLTQESRVSRIILIKPTDRRKSIRNSFKD